MMGTNVTATRKAADANLRRCHADVSVRLLESNAAAIRPVLRDSSHACIGPARETLSRNCVTSGDGWTFPLFVSTDATESHPRLDGISRLGRLQCGVLGTHLAACHHRCPCRGCANTATA